MSFNEHKDLWIRLFFDPNFIILFFVFMFFLSFSYYLSHTYSRNRFTTFINTIYTYLDFTQIKNDDMNEEY